MPLIIAVLERLATMRWNPLETLNVHLVDLLRPFSSGQDGRHGVWISSINNVKNNDRSWASHSLDIQSRNGTGGKPSCSHDALAT